MSDHPLARGVRRSRRAIFQFEAPAPRVVVRPLLMLYLLGRNTLYFLKQKFVCEPFLKAYCTSYGRNVRAGVYIPFVIGVGELHFADEARIHGKVTLAFGVRHSERPTIRVGYKSSLGHEVSIVASKGVTIGRYCHIAGGTMIVDSGGHPVDPAMRLADLPPMPSEVRPVVIEDNVWIGTRSIILPGVTIGEGSVISAGSVVRRSVPPYSLVMGNPAKVMVPLPRIEPATEPQARESQDAEPGGFPPA